MTLTSSDRRIRRATGRKASATAGMTTAYKSAGTARSGERKMVNVMSRASARFCTPTSYTIVTAWAAGSLASRLDGPGQFKSDGRGTNAFADFGAAMLVGVTIPTTGCWELTGTYRGERLSYVVRVAD